MTDMETPPPAPVRHKAGPNIYTVLVFVAFVALATAAGVTWYQNVQLTGNNNPFYLEPKGR
jgi:hypothetical protein